MGKKILKEIGLFALCMVAAFMVTTAADNFTDWALGMGAIVIGMIVQTIR